MGARHLLMLWLLSRARPFRLLSLRSVAFQSGACFSAPSSSPTWSGGSICTSAFLNMPTIGVKRDKLFEKLGRTYSESIGTLISR